MKDELKEKVTFSLSQNIVSRLEDAWFSLRKKFKGEHTITRSGIVEIALEKYIDEIFKDEEL